MSDSNNQTEPSWKKWENYQGPSEADRTVAMQAYRADRGWSTPAAQSGGPMSSRSPRFMKHRGLKINGVTVK